MRRKNRILGAAERNAAIEEGAARDPHNQKIEELQLQIAALEGAVERQAMELRFFKGALRRVEVARRQKEKTGDTASAPKSEA